LFLGENPVRAELQQAYESTCDRYFRQAVLSAVYRESGLSLDEFIEALFQAVESGEIMLLSAFSVRWTRDRVWREKLLPALRERFADKYPRDWKLRFWAPRYMVLRAKSTNKRRRDVRTSS